MTTFDDVADTYDDAFRDRWHRAEDAAVRRMIRPFIEGADVLDVGCGTGLGLTMGKPRTYLGIDPCPRMIERARERWTPPGPTGHWDDTDLVEQHTSRRDYMPSQPDFAVSSAELLQPPVASYDTILCLWSWPYVLDRWAALRAWFRCLRANGQVIIVSWDERYTPTVPIADHPQRIADVAALAIRYGFHPWTLGGLRRGVWTRIAARALPVTLGSRLVETGPEAPAWIMRLARPHIGQERPPSFHHGDRGLRPPSRMDLAVLTLPEPRLGWPPSPTSMPPGIAPAGARRLVAVPGGFDTTRPDATPGSPSRRVGGP